MYLKIVHDLLSHLIAFGYLIEILICVCDLFVVMPTVTSDDAHGKTIKQNFCFLTENVDLAAGLLTHLIQNQVVSDREAATLKLHVNSYEAVEELLIMLIRKSRRDYLCFLECLCATGQEHIARQLGR